MPARGLVPVTRASILCSGLGVSGAMYESGSTARRLARFIRMHDGFVEGALRRKREQTLLARALASSRE